MFSYEPLTLSEFKRTRSYDDYNFPDTESEFADDNVNDNFFLAFALTKYDEGGETIESPDYAVLKAYYHRWGSDAFLDYDEVKLRPCTLSELGLNENGKYGEDANFDNNVLKEGQRLFYPDNDSKEWVEFYHKRMVCLDDEDLSLLGNWDTFVA